MGVSNFECECIVCGDDKPVVLHPYQGFENQLGPFMYQDFALCEICEDIWQRRAIAMLSLRFINAHHHIFRNRYITQHDAYSLLCGLEVAAQIKSN